MDVPFLRGWGNSQSMFPLKLLEKVVGRQIFSTVRIGGLDIIMFFRYFFHAFVDFLRWSLFFRSYLSGRCRETRTFTKGFQQYDPISRKTRVVWIIDKWVWFPHDFQIRRLWWCTCWASSSSEGWMAMGSIKTQQWRLSSVLWPWSSGSVLGQERIRISSRWSTTCLAEIALRIRPPVEDGQGSWRWRYEIFGSMDLLYHVVQLEENLSWYQIPSRRWRPFHWTRWRPSFHHSGSEPWRSTDISSGSGGISSAEICAMDCFLNWSWGCKMRPATQLCGTCFTMKGAKCRKLWRPNVLIYFFSPFHTMKKDMAVQIIKTRTSMYIVLLLMVQNSC